METKQLPPTKRLIKSDYGIFDEKDIPLLIADSPQRKLLCFLVAFLIIAILAYASLMWIDFKERPKMLPFKDPAIKTMIPRTLDIMTPGIFGRWIYVYGMVPDDKVKLIGVLINNCIIPHKAFIEAPQEGALGLCRLDLGKDFLIHTIHIKSESALSRVLVRDVTGSKVFEYM